MMLAQWPRASSVPKVLLPGATSFSRKPSSGKLHGIRGAALRAAPSSVKPPARVPGAAVLPRTPPWRLRCAADHHGLATGVRNDETQQRVVIRTKSIFLLGKPSHMPKENDLEGRQDMGGKHGGQAGMPKPEERSSAQQGIVRDERGQEQPADKERAQHVSRKDRGDDPPGDPKQ